MSSHQPWLCPLWHLLAPRELGNPVSIHFFPRLSVGKCFQVLLNSWQKFLISRQPTSRILLFASQMPSSGLSSAHHTIPYSIPYSISMTTGATDRRAAEPTLQGEAEKRVHGHAPRARGQKHRRYESSGFLCPSASLPTRKGRTDASFPLFYLTISEGFSLPA